MRFSTKWLIGLITVSAISALILSRYQKSRSELNAYIDKLDSLQLKVSRTELISTLGLLELDSLKTGMSDIDGQMKPKDLSLPMTEEWFLPLKHRLVVNYGIRLPDGHPFVISFLLTNSENEILVVR